MEEEEEKRSDTPERRDKDDLEEKENRKDSDSKQKEEQDPEEKEQDTAEVKGANANLELYEKVDSKEDKKDSSETSTNSGEVPRLKDEAGSDVSLLSPKRHLERQVKTSFCDLKVCSSFFCLNSTF